MNSISKKIVFVFLVILIGAVLFGCSKREARSIGNRVRDGLAGGTKTATIVAPSPLAVEETPKAPAGGNNTPTGKCNGDVEWICQFIGESAYGEGENQDLATFYGTRYLQMGWGPYAVESLKKEIAGDLSQRGYTPENPSATDNTPSTPPALLQTYKTPVAVVVVESTPIMASTPLPRQTPQATCLVGGVSGSVYEDANGNKKFDNGEKPRKGVAVRLQEPDSFGVIEGKVINTTTTDESGNFTLTAPKFASYKIALEEPKGWSATTPNSFPVNLFGCGTVSGFNFGIKQ